MKRFPEKTALISSALTTLAIVNSWAVVVYLHNFPGLIKQLSVLEVLIILAYVLFSALVESLVIFIILTALSALLPPRMLRSAFSVRSGIFLQLFTLYIVPFHTYIPRITTLIFEPTVTIFIAAWTVIFIVEILLFHMIVQRYPKFNQKAEAVFDRVSVLGTIYLVLDLISSGIVLIANWK